MLYGFKDLFKVFVILPIVAYLSFAIGSVAGWYIIGEEEPALIVAVATAVIGSIAYIVRDVRQSKLRLIKRASSLGC